MSRFFKSLFSSSSSLSSDKKKISKSKQDVSTYSNNSVPSDVEEKEFNTPYDTKRKMFTSRSGRMKHNQKIRGTLRKDMFGDVGRYEEKSSTEYHVHGPAFTQELFNQPAVAAGEDSLKKSLENVYKMAKEDELKPKTVADTAICESGKQDINMDQEIEQMFKPVLLETKF